jgi:hypothetical protein
LILHPGSGMGKIRIRIRNTDYGTYFFTEFVGPLF